MLLDQLAQRVDRRAGRLERDRARAGARAARREPRHLDRDQREQPAHGDAKARARQEPLLVQFGREPQQPIALGLAERHDRIGRERLEARERLAAAVAHRLGDVLGEASSPSRR